MNNDIKFLVIDLFCGAGGTTTGFESATLGGNKIAKVIACVNHDPEAIASHEANHPHCLHFIEDIRTLNLSALSWYLQAERMQYPSAKVVLWASLECTNFSNAKGGKPRDADSRSLADHMPRYIQALEPDYFMVENVREFMAWGPLNKNGKPESRTAGRDYQRWIREVCETGNFRHEYKLLNAADFGAYTSRLRYFAIFARPDCPITWPKATHAKKTENGMFGALKQWKPVRDVLDLSDEGQSIFTRKKPLSEKTLQRIYAGLIKHVGNGDEAFLVKYLGNDPKTGINTGKSINEPCTAVTTQNRLYIASAHFLSKYYSGKPEHKNLSLEGPTGAMTTTDSHALISAKFIVQRQNDVPGRNPAGRVISLDVPARTITTTGGNQELVNPVFLDQQYGNSKPASVDEPSGSLTANPKMNVVQCGFIANYYSGGRQTESVDEPTTALTTIPKQRVVQCIMTNQHANAARSLDEPAPTVLTGNHHYLLNAQFNHTLRTVDDTHPTITADRHWPYLVVTESGQLAIELLEGDSETMIKIKAFMVEYGMVDIRMRMLKIPELKRIQGFGDTYILHGTQTEQKKFIGNAVHPIVTKALAGSLAYSLLFSPQLF